LGLKIVKSYHSFLEMEYFVTNCPFLIKIFSKLETKNWFLGEGVATFMCTGYTFLSSLEMGHQLSQKLPRDADHFGSIMDMKKNIDSVFF